jgi:hypothetical protein
VTNFRLHRQFDTTARPEAEGTTMPQREVPAVGQPQQARLPVTSGVGGGLDPLAHAAALVRASGGRLDRAGAALLRLQRGFGNRHVQQLVDLARQPVRPAPIVQASLVVGPSGDRHEQEADRVARQLAGPATQRPAAGSAGQENLGHTPVMRPVGGAHDGAVDPQVEQAVRGARGGGQPLPGRVRAPMERALGADFRGVRLHTDAQADQFSRMLGARAFTTGQEIFFRQGEYHPDGMPGQRLLAHELAHVVQQTGTVRDADGASPASTGVISPATGTAVVQRVKIGELDTEDRADLRVLKAKVEKMETLEEIDTMRAQIPEKQTPSEKALAEDLDVARILLASRLRRAQPRRTEPRRTEPRRTEPRTGPGETGLTKTKVLPEVQASPVLVPPEPTGPESPVPTRQARVTERQRQEAEEKAKQEAEKEKVETVAKTGPSREARAAERQRQEAEEKAKQEAEKEKVEAVKKKAEGLRGLAAQLGNPSDAPEVQITWLQNFGKLEFEQREREWAEAVKALGSRQGGREVTELIRQVDQEITSVKAAKSRIERSEEGRRQKEQEERRLRETQRQREEEVQQGEALIDAYVGTLETEPLEWNLLIRWVFTKAVAQLAQNGDDRITTLLEYLKQHRTNERRQGERGPWVELTGDAEAVGVRGAGYPNSITLTIPLWGPTPSILLTSSDQEGNRNKLIAATAKGFIHETAHLRQLRIYENVSHPFREPKQVITTDKPDTGIQWNLWPAEVKVAYQEFEAGGNEKLMTEDERNEWIRALKGIAGAEYYQRGYKDFRARELVSHLIEIAYTWGSRRRFDAVFPKCAALLDRVIIRGADVNI